MLKYPGQGMEDIIRVARSSAQRLTHQFSCSRTTRWLVSRLKRGCAAKSIKEQIDLAFKNIDVAIKHAGGKGVTQVYRITSYHIEISSKVLGYFKKIMEKWIPHHKPVWTAEGQIKLGMDSMLVEIDAVTYDPRNAKWMRRFGAAYRLLWSLSNSLSVD